MPPELAAAIGYEAVRALCRALGQPNPLDWASAPPHWREVSLDCALSIRACPDCDRPGFVHDTWIAAKARQGWTYGPERDEARKLSPLLVPYGDLPESERAKDRLFQAVVRALIPHPAPPHHFDADRFAEGR